MPWKATPISLTDDERSTLEAWVRAATTEQRFVLRARIILAAERGETTTAIAARLCVTPVTVSKWRTRFAKDRLVGLQDGVRPGKPARYTVETERRVLAQLDEPPPAGYAQWTGPLLAAALGDVSDDHVWRILRRHNIDLQGAKSWCESSDPEFGAKAADIIGLYLAPPENAIVLCVDEKSQIQALDRTQKLLPVQAGQTEQRTHDCFRHGTATLFAALEIATGKVTGLCKQRHRHQEFLAFLNHMLPARPLPRDAFVVSQRGNRSRVPRVRIGELPLQLPEHRPRPRRGRVVGVILINVDQPLRRLVCTISPGESRDIKEVANLVSLHDEIGLNSKQLGFRWHR